jgi:hypothetical protein
VDSLSTATRGRLDSVKAWVNDRSQKMTTDQEERTVDMAKVAWQDAKSKLPKDLTDYERKVAVKELQETVRSWFELTDEEWKTVLDESSAP